MSKSEKALKETIGKVEQLLVAHSYSKACYPLEDLVSTIMGTEKIIWRKLKTYKWFGFILLTAIPVTSTILSVAITSNGGEGGAGTGDIFAWLKPYVPHLSVSLTLMTLLNAIFKPSERFQTVCSLSIKVSHFKSDVMAEIEKLSPFNEQKLLDLVDKFRSSFEPYQEQLVGLFMPEAVRKTS